MNIQELVQEPIERDRYGTLVKTLSPWKHLYQGKRCLDFGASYGLSMLALLETGAQEVLGTEPDAQRVERGQAILRKAAYDGRLRLILSSYEPRIEFPDASFEFVLSNAVLEHIPQPRSEYIKELWRVLDRGGHLLINETPNKYLPWDFHTTGGLWFVPWLPREAARRYAIWRGKWSHDRDWNSSGWRGAGYWEITRHLPGHRTIPELTRARHRVFNSLGLPSNFLDPYPTYIFQKL